jgi:hypothetical protein
MAEYREDKTTNKHSALVKPIDTEVLPPKTNPLDEGVLLQTSTQQSLTTDEITEDLTTPEASLSHTELESEDDIPEFANDTDSDEGLQSDTTSQSTLSGSSFHTTQLAPGDYADSDESQQWQITETERGTGTIER